MLNENVSNINFFIWIMLFIIELFPNKQTIFYTMNYSLFSTFIVVVYKTISDIVNYSSNHKNTSFEETAFWLFIINNFFIRTNFQTIVLFIKNILCDCKINNLQSNTIIINITNEYLELIKNNFIPIEANNYKLIDFGCGDCSTLQQLKWSKKIGVDLDHSCILKSKQLIKNKNIKNINLIEANILNLDFPNEFILYMYEPLWLCSSNKIYIDLFKYLKQENKKGFIIYISGLWKKHLLDEDFHNNNINILSKLKVGSIFINRNVYLLYI
jgi:hypothetical protein